MGEGAMLTFVLWVLLLAGLLALLGFAWRSAQRHRGFKLLQLLSGEEILRHAVDVPMQVERAAGRGGAFPQLFTRRGTLVLTRKRLAGFAHRSRFVLVRGSRVPPTAVRAEDGWLVIRPVGKGEREREVVLRYSVPDAEGWAVDAVRVLRGR